MTDLTTIILALLLAVGGAVGDMPVAETTMTGSATWCAPTPTHCQRWGGNAMLGAVRSFRYGDKPYTVTVWHGARWARVRIVSYCACPRTLIDLSPAAFARLAPLARGRIPVTVTRVERGVPVVIAPETDVAR